MVLSAAIHCLSSNRVLQKHLFLNPDYDVVIDQTIHKFSSNSISVSVAACACSVLTSPLHIPVILNTFITMINE